MSLSKLLNSFFRLGKAIKRFEGKESAAEPIPNLHTRGPCVLCKGCESDSNFDYCRACGFTTLPGFRPEDL